MDHHNRRARSRAGRHPSDGLDSFERARQARPRDSDRIEAAYRRMAEAEARLVARFEDQGGASVPHDDPVRQLIRHSVTIPENGDWQLWLLGLGEKVAALGGHLQVRAVFPDTEITLITEPGPEQQPPILPPPAAPDEHATEAPAPPRPVDLTVPLAVELTDDEHYMILQALTEWEMGVTSPTDEIAVAMGFADLADLKAQLPRLFAAMQAREPLLPVDWRRILLTTEIGFASDYYGAGWEWWTVTQLEDFDSLLTLRDLQFKLIGIANLIPSSRNARAADFDIDALLADDDLDDGDGV